MTEDQIDVKADEVQEIWNKLEIELKNKGFALDLHYGELCARDIASKEIVWWF
mgnify:CR=1 FL=1|jgi:inorganic triphosphatase YgiF|tara:strand:- start:5059 stop:5217 length:159 start_codon:yes stop_codon:yes gene_type:complete